MPSKSTSKHTRGRDEAQAVIRRLFERVYSKGELVGVDDLVASDFTGSSTETADAYRGPAGIKTHVSRLRAAFLSFTLEINDLHVEGDTFEVSWTARGTHERQFLGVDPTSNTGLAGDVPHGNRIAVSGATTGTIRNGKIQESRMGWDVESLRRQLDASVENIEPATDTRESTAQKPPLLERETL